MEVSEEMTKIRSLESILGIHLQKDHILNEDGYEKENNAVQNWERQIEKVFALEEIIKKMATSTYSILVDLLFQSLKITWMFILLIWEYMIDFVNIYSTF